MEDSKNKFVARNKKAFHEYEIIEKFEVGIVLQGTEIKSVRESKVAFKDAFVEIKNGEAWLIGFNIAQYTFGNIWNHEEERKRKLLMHKTEILKLHQKIKERGLTLIPLDIYIKYGRAKVTVALAKGKALYDKRDSIKKKDQEREMRRIQKNY